MVHVKMILNIVKYILKLNAKPVTKIHFFKVVYAIKKLKIVKLRLKVHVIHAMMNLLFLIKNV